MSMEPYWMGERMRRSEAALPEVRVYAGFVHHPHFYIGLRETMEQGWMGHPKERAQARDTRHYQLRCVADALREMRTKEEA